MPGRTWGTWTSRLLILLGSTLFLAGVVFFFAFNWNYIPPFWKLAIIELAIAIGIGGAVYFSLDSLVGKISTLTAGLMVGVFLAVFGQIYQTGANAYSLFVPWALLIIPWGIFARFNAFWFMWFVISQVALFTYWSQGLLPDKNLFLLVFSLAAMSGLLFAALKDWLFDKSADAPVITWVLNLTVFYVLGMISIPLNFFIFEQSLLNTGATIGLLLGIIIFTGSYYFFRWRRADKISLTATVSFISVAFGSLATKIIFWQSSSFESSGQFLLLAVLYLGITGIAISHLRHVFKGLGVTNG